METSAERYLIDEHIMPPPIASRRILRIRVIHYIVRGVQLEAESELSQFVALAERGHQVTCFVARTPQSRNIDLTARGLKLETVLLRRLVPVVSYIFFEFMACLRLIRSLARYDGVILDVYSVPFLFPVLLALRLCSPSRALLLRIDTVPVETVGLLASLQWSFFHTLSTKLAATLFDKILCISPMMCELYLRQFGIPEEKMGVWPSAVNTDLFVPVSISKANRLRKELGISTKCVVLYHGLLSRARGIMQMVEAFGILKQKGVDATLVLLGDGPAREEIRRYVQANHLDDVVLVCGPVDYAQVPDYIGACDAGIVALPDNPWWRYQCPTKVLECLAMNKPLIVSDIPAHRWIIGSAPVALYLKGTGSQEIARGIRTFIATRHTLEPSLGRQIASSFSMAKIAQMLEGEVLSVILRAASRSKMQTVANSQDFHS